MQKKRTPIHVAIIMDGNGRWAKKRKKPRNFGHKEGADNLIRILKHAKKQGVKYLTVYAFSTENWKRPKKEVNLLMKLFETYLKNEKENLMKNSVKLVFSGTKENISDKLLDVMAQTKDYLKDNNGIVFNIAFNYGGRKEIVDAVNLAIKNGVTNIDENIIKKNLYQPDIPDPDLLIRTSNEFRISNFLLWEIAYSEIYITKVLWPDFNEEELDKALEDYKKRDRRYGGVKE